MITNLLDKNVLYDGKDCKICAIYQCEDKIFFCLVDEEGKLTDKVRPNMFKINEQRIHSVFLYYAPHHKIHAIKTVREILGLGLREAKDLVEANPDGVPIKTRLTPEEAKEVMRIITSNNLEGSIK